MTNSKCPHCSTELAMTKLSDGGVAFLCNTCGGANIGLGLLKRKMDPDVISKIWTAAGAEGTQGENRCPTCPRTMTLITTKGTTPLELDICTNCYHIWFDKSEIEKLPKNPQGTTPFPSGPSKTGNYTLDHPTPMPQMRQYYSDTYFLSAAINLLDLYFRSS